LVQSNYSAPGPISIKFPGNKRQACELDGCGV
jgi:hypothetical protein